MRRFVAVAVLALPLLLGGCLEPDKADLLAKAEGVTTKAQLRDRLGQPDDVAKLGPVETWTYTAADGTVSFLIAGDTVTLTTTGEKPRQR